MGNLKLSPVNWQKIRTRTLKITRFPNNPTRVQPISPFIFTVDTPVCIVLMSNPQAKFNWWSAGFANAYLFSGAFVSRSLISIKQWQIGLDRAALLDFRKYKTSNRKYAIELTTRPWHTQMKIQVWKYRGSVDDSVDEYQQQIKAALDEVRELTQNLTEFSL